MTTATPGTAGTPEHDHPFQGPLIKPPASTAIPSSRETQADSRSPGAPDVRKVSTRSLLSQRRRSSVSTKDEATRRAIAVGVQRRASIFRKATESPHSMAGTTTKTTKSSSMSSTGVSAIRHKYATMLTTRVSIGSITQDMSKCALGP